MSGYNQVARAGEARSALPNEKLIMDWDNIAAMFGVSVRKMISYREEIQNGGFIFYRYEGKPPQKRVCAFPSSFKKWIAIRSAKVEVFGLFSRAAFWRRLKERGYDPSAVTYPIII